MGCIRLQTFDVIFYNFGDVKESVNAQSVKIRSVTR